MITDINSEDRLVQKTFAEHLKKALGWESAYAYNNETFGPHGTLGRSSERDVVLVRDLHAALGRLNADLPASALDQAIEKLTHIDFARSLLQHNRELDGFIRGGVPVDWRDEAGETRHARARVIDFRNASNNRFLAVRELKLQGVRVPHYNRRADLICFVNGLPLVFIELKAVYRNIRAGFDNNLTDYLNEHSISHAFHHNAFLVVSNGDHARYGSITSKWEHFVEHCSTRWQTGKSMLVCIDKITCGRMFQRIEPRWQAKLAQVRALIPVKEAELADTNDPDVKERLAKNLEFLCGQAQWMESTIIEIIISEAQNEVRDFQRWGIDIIPHRVVMKTGFHTADGKRVDVDDAFKDPQHPFRIAIVCAMWLTGFDVECLATLYIDKPMKAHNLMQAIARANRVYPGKDCGVIVDYNGMLKSLREALAQYALGDEAEGGGGGDIVASIEELVAALVQAIEAAEKHLRGLGFDPYRLRGATGFTRIEALRDAVEALYSSDEAKHRFEIMAQQVFIRFRALLMEPSAFAYAERHDNIEAVYKKLQEKRDTADVTEVLKELHRIVNEAIRAQAPGEDHAEGLKVDLSQIDFEKLRDEFTSKVRRKHAALQDIRDVVEKKLVQMLGRNPTRMDYYKKYQEIIADYNREKDRVTVEETFARLVDFANRLDAEQRRAAEEGLNDDELALFDLLFKENISKANRERLKQASRSLLASLRELLRPMHDWTKNTATQAEVKVFILDNLWEALPRPPFSDGETEEVANRVYEYVWQWSASGHDLLAA